MKKLITGYLLRNPIKKYKLYASETIVGKYSKAEIESMELRGLQVTANKYNKPVKLASAFLRQLEPEALSAVNIYNKIYLKPEAMRLVLMTVEDLKTQTNFEEMQGHYSQLI